MWKPTIRLLSVTPFVTHMYGLFLCAYCVFSRDVMDPIFVSQINETAAMSVSQNNPVGLKFFSYVNAFFCSNKFCIDAGHVSENTEYMRVCEKIKERTQVYVAKKKNARISCSRNDCKYTWEKTARILCHNFETISRS